ncbi:Rieske (2Fe-2S) protein [Micromonospora polyrhachis]|uniref:Nitrite reductase/ring-hydroxylating ferredoxin subunit n=1 Tax=Micromonospora polyrhachis TaxID=1282883 RepID=A0A7W7WRU0_9ACTN|nr:Rieske (2Fe-2S) protein [Micromonospora polyrhachis]MBB4961445.1 nitrite reductase/ring-hydroxylating ferredoxin subunit [Micromonospora polyrhachis]
MSEDQAVPGSGARTRRVLLASAGAVGVAAVLAACGSDDSDGDAGREGTTGNGTGAPPTGSDPGSSGTAPGNSGALARTSDIPVGGGKIFAEQGVVITQPTAGEFKGFSALCTHKECPLSSVDGGTINCTCHGSKFSVVDGSVKVKPATEPLPEKKIKVEGDQIHLL